VGKDKVSTLLGRYIDEVAQWLEMVAVAGRRVVAWWRERTTVEGRDSPV